MVKTMALTNWVYDAEFQLGELKGDRTVIYYQNQYTGACYASNSIVVEPVRSIG
jgi:hypothetical protein